MEKRAKKRTARKAKTQAQWSGGQQQQTVNVVLKALGRDGGRGGGKGNGKVGGKGNGKAKGKPYTRPSPRALIGMQLEHDGKPVCYAFNLEGWKHEGAITPGSKCEHGWHICLKPGCGGPHKLSDHK